MSANAKDSQPWAIIPLLKTTTDYLTGKGIDSARLDAEVLLSSVLGISRIELYTRFEHNLAEAELNAYRELVRRRSTREPVAYILGEKEFYSLPFKITPAVLIPRPETEILVEEAVRLCKNFTKNNPRILDLGTGSGCIAVAVAHSCPEAQIIATDISTEALTIAQGNANHNRMTERIEFKSGNLYAAVAGEVFDLILCNPPYIAENDPEVMPDVARFEPAQALFAGKDGLDVYRALAAGLDKMLSADGVAIFEIGEGQAEAISKLFREAAFIHLTVKKDHAGIDRLLIVSRNKLPAQNPRRGAGNIETERMPSNGNEYIQEPEGIYPENYEVVSEEMQAKLDKALDAYGEDNI